MLTQGDTYNRPAYGVCDFPADFTNVDPNSPERRAAAAWTLTDDNRFMVFGGKTDCGNANDVWALDLDTEASIVESLRDSDATLLVIAHRLSTVRHADQIVLLDEGVIKERGTHEQLWRRAGLYREFCDHQFQAPPATGARA